ncbi:MAG TPA: hypothetical protein VGB98_14750 [Pyrinomonadaceae bacterium]|jgi:hypothetical protein
MRSPERSSDTKRTRAGTCLLVAVTLACYLAAAACVFAVGYTLAALAAHDAGRFASAFAAKHGL